MNELHKEIIEKLFEIKLNDDDLVIINNSPKSGIDCWVGYTKNIDKNNEHFYNIIKNGLDNITLNNNSIFNWGFTHLIISKHKDKAIKAMTRLKPNRDWNYFEINSVIINNNEYVAVWD